MTTKIIMRNDTTGVDVSPDSPTSFNNLGSYKFSDYKLSEMSSTSYSKLQKFIFTDKKGEASSLEQWQSIVSSRFPVNVPKENSNVSILLPTDRTTDNNLLPAQGSPFYDVRNVFNYQAANFFAYVQDLDEKHLPCYYLLNSRIANRKAFNLPKIDKEMFVDFNKKYKKYFRMKAQEDLNKMNNMFFDSDYSFSKGSEFVQEYPIYAHIKFNTIKNHSLRPILDDLGMYKMFVDSFFATNTRMQLFDVSEALGNITPQQTYKMVNISEIINNISFTRAQPTRINFLTKHSADSGFSKNIKRLLLIGKLRDLSKDKIRTYEQIINGEEAEHEFMFYKVEKYSSSIRTTPVQTFWLSSKQEMVNLFDTQIKNNQEYIYLVSGFAAIYGTTYVFESVKAYEQEGRFMARVVCRSLPAFQLTEIPLFTKKLAFSQVAPLPPFVQFINESNSTNRLKIYLDLKSGDDFSTFTTINNIDQMQLPIMKPKEDDDTLFHFKYTKDLGAFEVFKTMQKPSTYSDFAGSKVKDVRSDRSSSIVLVDKILPRRKYYYMFRSKNSNNFVSNPSPVFEVELIKDSNDSRLIIKTIKMEEGTADYQPTAKFKRFFQIIPAIQHTILETYNKEQSPKSIHTFKDTIDDLRLGIAEKSLWGKKFKIRVKSTDSGKIIDFNVKFNLIKNKSVEEFD